MATIIGSLARGLVLASLLIGAAPTPASAQQTITQKARDLNESFDADVAHWAERFEHEGRAIYDKRYAILDAMGLEPGMDVADIGAGTGLISRLIAQRVAPGGTVYAVDIAKNMIDRIENIVRDEKIPNLISIKHTIEFFFMVKHFIIAE